MKKGILGIFIVFCMFGCAPYSISGYNNQSIALEEYSFSVGYFFNHTSRMNNLPKAGLVFYVQHKSEKQRIINVLNVESKVYRELKPFTSKSFLDGNLFLKIRLGKREKRPMKRLKQIQ